MVSEREYLLEPDDVIFVIRISIPEMSEDFNFNSCLVLEARIILNNLNSNFFSILMIKSLVCLTKTSSTEPVEDLKSVPKMIIDDDFIVASIVVIATVVFL